jgi:hypothetical protein
MDRIIVSFAGNKYEFIHSNVKGYSYWYGISGENTGMIPSIKVQAKLRECAIDSGWGHRDFIHPSNRPKIVTRVPKVHTRVDGHKAEVRKDGKVRIFLFG